MRDVKTGLTWIAPGGAGPPQARRRGRQHRGLGPASPAMPASWVDVSLSGVYARDRSRISAGRRHRRPQAVDAGRSVARRRPCCAASTSRSSGRVHIEADGHGDVRSIAIEVTGGNGTVALPGVLPAPHRVKSVNARATVDAATHTAKIERVDVDFGADEGVDHGGAGERQPEGPGLHRPGRGEAHPGRPAGRLLAAGVRRRRPAVGAGQSQQRRDRCRRRVRAERARATTWPRSRSIASSA